MLVFQEIYHKNLVSQFIPVSQNQRRLGVVGPFPLSKMKSRVRIWQIRKSEFAWQSAIYKDSLCNAFQVQLNGRKVEWYIVVLQLTFTGDLSPPLALQNVKSSRPTVNSQRLSVAYVLGPIKWSDDQSGSCFDFNSHTPGINLNHELCKNGWFRWAYMGL